MAKLIDITGKAISGEWGTDDLVGNGVPVLRTTNFSNIGVVNFNNVVTRQIVKKSISEKLLRYGDIIIEKSGGSDKQPVGRVVFFEGEDNKYLFNNFTGLLRVRDFCKWNPKYIFYSLFANYAKGGTIPFENRTTGLHNLQTDSYVNSVMIVERKIEEQTDIVTILDKVNQLINYEKKQLEDLDILVKSRFIEMFGENKSKNHFGKLSDVCLDIIAGGDRPNEISYEQTEEYCYPVFANARTNNGLLYYAKSYKIASKAVTIAARGATVGFTAIRDSYFTPIVRLITLIPNKSMNVYYMKYYIGYNLRIVSSGSAQPQLTVPYIKNLKILIPTSDMQNQFASFVMQVDKSKFVVTAKFQ